MHLIGIEQLFDQLLCDKGVSDDIIIITDINDISHKFNHVPLIAIAYQRSFLRSYIHPSRILAGNDETLL